jgi:hypothetical protein
VKFVFFRIKKIKYISVPVKTGSYGNDHSPTIWFANAVDRFGDSFEISIATLTDTDIQPVRLGFPQHQIKIILVV